LLPTAFVEEETGVRQVGAMLGFLFSMESLALSLGCDRTQLELAVRQCHPESAAKIALLWAARHQLGVLPLAELRERVDELLGNPLVVPAVPQYVSGFVQALEAVPRLVPFVVETLSKAFARLPDPVLLPWLPVLITTLKSQAAELVPVLTREAGRTFPGSLAALDTWTAPWKARPKPAVATSRPSSGAAGVLLAEHPATTEAVAALLGCAGEWSVAGGDAEGPAPVGLLTEHPETAEAVAALIGG
jgi:hypothetical protein